ncbi:MAG: carbamoyl-phosphate synthase (glutamine-hydrolyzing) large subunit [Candidatus Magasanikbacteria bacterium]
MTNTKKIKKVLILGSGGLRIGQAGEFDYSGSQAIKALKQEGIKTVLINPNIATVQTDAGLADTVYLQPLNIETVTRIIAKEKPDGILLGFGGQTALNLGLKLDSRGVLKKYGVAVLGTPVSAIRITEDRELFKKSLEKIGVKSARSFAVSTVKDALIAGEKIGYPLMIRSGYSLGGLGSGRIDSAEQLKDRATESLHGAPQVLIEEYLGGWKEIEYEMVRDAGDNTIAVCNMENFDPMGIHTGESIVVAPSQTLNNEEYHRLRAIAIKTIKHLGIIGECNIQYALHPDTGDYRVIEVNARLSRSSALASKATGYPLAFVAAKLALGKKLSEIKNSVTKTTTAFFEPALDYLVVKIPRWDLNKFRSPVREIGSEMKSVGEVMAIGHSFPEALQKATRMLNIGVSGITDYPEEILNLRAELSCPTDRRLFALAQFFAEGKTVASAHELTKIDEWFLHHIYDIVQKAHELKKQSLTSALILSAKKLGFADKTIAKIKITTEAKIRAFRLKNNIKPFIKQIDTLSGEFPAETNYLYTTYHASVSDIAPSPVKPIIVLGSGPYCIGSSVEFDWCAVNTARTLRALNQPTVIINSNPETVSTDYDESDRLYFEELTLERIADIADFEKSAGLIVSVGGQIPNNLAIPLENAGYPILGTSPASIDRAEDREKFSSLLNQLNIDQPEWQRVTDIHSAKIFARQIEYPVLIRPSYVLSGAAMNVVYTENELAEYLEKAAVVSSEFPVVMSKFILNAKELELDGVAQNGKIIIEAIAEHIENAGIHSGDATIVLPPQRLYLETIRQTKNIGRAIVKALHITGPFNIQFIAKENSVKVIECNLRASRSFPFASKVTGHNFIDIATRAMLGVIKNENYETLELDHVGVKTPQFSYQRLKGSDPVAHVEMASTGEVACIGDNFLEAFYASWLATEQSVAGKRVMISIGGENKVKLLEPIRELEKQGWEIYATVHTHDFLTRNGVAANFIYKVSDGHEPNVATLIANKGVDLIVNIPRGLSPTTQTDGYLIRRLAVDHHIPLLSNLQTAGLLLRCLTELDTKKMPVKSWNEFIY